MGKEEKKFRRIFEHFVPGPIYYLPYMDVNDFFHYIIYRDHNKRFSE